MTNSFALPHKDHYTVAVIGASGAVGNEMIKILETRNFPISQLIPLASDRSLGKSVSFKGETYPIQLLTENAFSGVDIALFSAGSTVSEKYAPIAAKNGAVVIDNTNYFRMDPDVPLIVPEVNPEEISSYRKRGIIANPNCSTIQMVIALKPILDRWGLIRVVVSTYQSVSGAGQAAIEELSKQSVALFSNGEYTAQRFQHRIAFNCIPHIDTFHDNGYTKEELKMIHETEKIFGTPIPLTATCVRVPVFYAHSESINFQTQRKTTCQEIRDALKMFNGIWVIDNPEKNQYPMPIIAAGKDDVFVGRIRQDLTVDNGFNMWVVSDNLRKGAALNAVQIAEHLIASHT